MNKFIAFIFTFAMLAYAGSSYAEQGNGIHWHTNYQEALNQARSSSKPVILFFTGSDWCGYCKKLDKEALRTPEFANAAGDKFVFVLVDFPRRTQLDAATQSQNHELQKRHQIRGYPTLVIIDGEENPIGVTGYRAGGGAQYADHLLKMIENYSAYQNKVQSFNNN